MSDEIGFVSILPQDGDGWAMNGASQVWSARGSGSTTRQARRRGGTRRGDPAPHGEPQPPGRDRRGTASRGDARPAAGVRRRRGPPSPEGRPHPSTLRCPSRRNAGVAGLYWRAQACETGRCSPCTHDASAGNPASRAIRGPRRWTARERERRQAPGPACASPRSRRRRRLADRRVVGRRPACRAAQRGPAPHRSSSGCARSGDGSSPRPTDTRSRTRPSTRSGSKSWSDRRAVRCARAVPVRRPRPSRAR